MHFHSYFFPAKVFRSGFSGCESHTTCIELVLVLVLVHIGFGIGTNFMLSAYAYVEYIILLEQIRFFFYCSIGTPSH